MKVTIKETTIVKETKIDIPEIPEITAIPEIYIIEIETYLNEECVTTREFITNNLDESLDLFLTNDLNKTVSVYRTEFINGIMIKTGKIFEY